MKVGHAFFEGAEFHGPADFSCCVIEGNFSIPPWKQGDSLIPTTFRRNVNFGGADIRGSFEGKGAQFLNEIHSANFNSMKVGSPPFSITPQIQKGPGELRIGRNRYAVLR